MDLDPKNLDVLSHYAEVLHDLNKLDQAAARFDQALCIDPNHEFSLRGYARVLRAQNNIAQALNIEEKLAKLPRK